MGFALVLACWCTVGACVLSGTWFWCFALTKGGCFRWVGRRFLRNLGLCIVIVLLLVGLWSLKIGFVCARIALLFVWGLCVHVWRSGCYMCGDCLQISLGLILCLCIC